MKIPSKRTIIWLVVGGIAAIFVLPWLAGFFVGFTGPDGHIKSVVKIFTDDWNKRDATELGPLWCSGAVPDAITLNKQISWYGHIETSVSDINASGDEATAAVEVTSSNGFSDRYAWSFLKEGGSWKVCRTNFRFSQLPPEMPN